MHINSSFHGVAQIKGLEEKVHFEIETTNLADFFQEKSNLNRANCFIENAK